MNTQNTDFSPSAYRIMGVSGFIEVVALTLWSYELFANMRAGKKLETDSSTPLVSISRINRGGMV